MSLWDRFVRWVRARVKQPASVKGAVYGTS